MRPVNKVQINKEVFEIDLSDESLTPKIIFQQVLTNCKPEKVDISSRSTIIFSWGEDKLTYEDEFSVGVTLYNKAIEYYVSWKGNIVRADWFDGYKPNG
jgi:hypothetical protein